MPRFSNAGPPKMAATKTTKVLAHREVIKASAAAAEAVTADETIEPLVASDNEDEDVDVDGDAVDNIANEDLCRIPSDQESETIVLEMEPPPTTGDAPPLSAPELDRFAAAEAEAEDAPPPPSKQQILAAMACKGRRQPTKEQSLRRTKRAKKPTNRLIPDDNVVVALKKPKKKVAAKALLLQAKRAAQKEKKIKKQQPKQKINVRDKNDDGDKLSRTMKAPMTKGELVPIEDLENNSGDAGDADYDQENSSDDDEESEEYDDDEALDLDRDDNEVATSSFAKAIAAAPPMQLREERTPSMHQRNDELHQKVDPDAGIISWRAYVDTKDESPLRKRPFQRIVRDVMYDACKDLGIEGRTKISAIAMDTLQIAAQHYLMNVFESARVIQTRVETNDGLLVKAVDEGNANGKRKRHKFFREELSIGAFREAVIQDQRIADSHRSNA